MESYFDKQVKCLYERTDEIINKATMLKANSNNEKIDIEVPRDFKDEFFKVVDKVNLSLMD